MPDVDGPEKRQTGGRSRTGKEADGRKEPDRKRDRRAEGAGPEKRQTGKETDGRKERSEWSPSGEWPVNFN